MLLGVDVGGTFTDAALLDGERLYTAKAPTTPEDQSEGVIAVVEQVLGRAEARAEQVESLTHGMTVGTNALLEERGARTALVATRGFADLIEIGRQDRPRLYHPCVGRPELGEIAVGKAADLALFKLDELRFSGHGDPLAALVLCGAHRADHVMVGGRWIVKNGEIPQLDQAELIARHSAAARKLQSAG